MKYQRRSERAPISVEVYGLIDGKGIDREKLQADLQRVLDPYGLTAKVLGGVITLPEDRVDLRER